MILSTTCYLEKDGKYLMLYRDKKESDMNEGKWLGVGGKFEPGESPEDCMRREIWEETGFTVRRWRYRGLVTFVSDTWDTEYMHLFTIQDWTGEAKDCDEGTLRWIDRERLLELPMWEGDRLFLELLGQDVSFFSLKLCYEGEKLVYAEKDGRPCGGAA